MRDGLHPRDFKHYVHTNDRNTKTRVWMVYSTGNYKLYCQQNELLPVCPVPIGIFYCNKTFFLKKVNPTKRFCGGILFILYELCTSLCGKNII